MTEAPPRDDAARDDAPGGAAPALRALLGLLAVILVLVAVAVPAGWALARAFGAPDGATLAGWRSLIEGVAYRERFLFSLAQAAGATALGLATGLPAAWLLARRGFPLRRVLTATLIAPVAIPGVVYALGMDILAGGAIEARALIVGTHAAFALGVTVWLVTPAIGGDRRLSDDARLLGASRWRAFWAVTWRGARPAARLAAALAFLHSYVAYATVILLGGAQDRTLEVTLGEATQGGVASAEVAALAVVQAGVAGLAFAGGGLRWRLPGERLPRASTPVVVLGAAYLVPLVTLVLAAPTALARHALREDGRASGSAFRGLLDASVAGQDVVGLLGWTVVYALIAAGVATLAAWPASKLLGRTQGAASVVVAVLAAPLLVTPVALAFAMRGAGMDAGIEVGRTWALVVAAHAAIAYPFALRVLTSRGTAEHDARLIEAATLLGQSPRRAAWRWGRRRVVRALGAAALVAAVVSAGEVGAAALLAPASVTPTSVALLEAAREAGASSATTAALATTLMAVTVIAFLLAEWLRRGAARVEAR